MLSSQSSVPQLVQPGAPPLPGGAAAAAPPDSAGEAIAQGLALYKAKEARENTNLIQIIVFLYYIPDHVYKELVPPTTAKSIKSKMPRIGNPYP